MQMAEQQLAFLVAQVHAVSSAVAKVLARGALACPHPFTVAVGVETVFPYVHKVVLVDVALMIVGTDAGARRNRPVYQYRADGDARLAIEQMVAYIAFVVAQESFASVADMDFFGLAGTLDEL